ncbi:hypothetical protein MRX96_026441 [Rhipicephalus microplus]
MGNPVKLFFYAGGIFLTYFYYGVLHEEMIRAPIHCRHMPQCRCRKRSLIWVIVPALVMSLLTLLALFERSR